MKEIESLNTSESDGYVYVRERAAMERLIQRIDTAERVALDTEADSLHNYFEKVCLVQLSLGGEHYHHRPSCRIGPERIIGSLGRQAVNSPRWRLRSAHDASVDRL